MPASHTSLARRGLRLLGALAFTAVVAGCATTTPAGKAVQLDGGAHCLARLVRPSSDLSR